MTPEEKSAKLEAIADAFLKECNDAGLRKLLDTEFWDTLEMPTQELLTVDQLIERYGHVLTEEEIVKLKNLTKPC